MKKCTLIIPLALANLLGYAQTIEYHEIDYLKDKSIISTIKVPFGSRYGLKIININKKILQIDNKVVQTSFNETAPALFEIFSKAKLPESSEGSAGLAPGNTILMDVSDISAAKIDEPLRKQLVALNLAYDKVAKEIFANEGLLTAFGDSYKNIKNVLDYQSKLLQLQVSCDLPFTGVITAVGQATEVSFKSTEMSQADRANLSKYDYLLNRAALNTYTTNLIDGAEQQYQTLGKNYVQSKREGLVKEVEAINKKIVDLIASLAIVKDKSVNSQITALKSERDGQDLSKLLNDNLERYSKVDIDKLYSDIQAFNSPGKKELFATYDYFTVSNWTYYVDPQPIDKDLTTISVSIKPKDGLVCNPQERTYEVNVKAKSGVKIDFSTGLFVNFGGNDFKDQSYRYEPVEGTTTHQRIVRNDPKNSIFPSVGALMHVYKRTGSDVNLGGVFGISTKDLEKINYHLGGSLMFGTSKRFVVSTGVTLTQAMLISDKYYAGQELEKANSPTDIPTSSFHRIGYFAAFTYNLGSK